MRHAGRRCAAAIATLLALTVSARSTSPGAHAVLATTETVTIEQALAAPSIAELRVSPSGALVAWLETREGRRNVIVADLAGGRRRALTRYAEDDGTTMSGLAWLPNSRGVIYVRGAARTQRGRIANPKDPSSIEDPTIWLVDADGSSPRRVGTGESPAVSPRGDGIAFVRGSEIWLATPRSSGAGEREPRRLLSDTGRPTSLVWSPVSDEIAFASERGDHSFIGVVSVSRRAVDYVSPSVDADSRPCWAADARRIAFLRLDAPVRDEDSSSASPARTDTQTPWSVTMVERSGVDTRFGPAREVWRAPARPGGTQPASAATTLGWLDAHRLVVASEHEGWARLYALDTREAAAAAIPLSPNESEIDETSIDSGRGVLVFSSNAGDSGRRHLWMARGGADRTALAAQLISGSTIDSAPVLSPDGRSVLFVRAGGRLPPAPALVDIASRHVRALGGTDPWSAVAERLVEPRRVTLTASDGLQVSGELFEPMTSAPSAGRPALVYVHGGPTTETLLGWPPLSFYHHLAYAMNQHLASRGYVVLSVNYRGSPGFGRAFRLAAGRGSDGAAEDLDVLAAALYLRALPGVDPRRVGIWGGSYGGYLTTLALARHSDVFASGVALHAAHDRTTRTSSRSGEARRLARESSPAASIARWRSPVLLIHGDDDPVVEFSQSISLVALLRQQRVPHELVVLPGETHSFAIHAQWVRACRAAADFFERTLAF